MVQQFLNRFCVRKLHGLHGANAANIRTVVLDITTSPDNTVSGTVDAVAVRSQNRVRIRNR